MDDHERWRERVTEVGARPTPVIDRFWFRSIYFREPSGVLFELATIGPGFGVDEDPDHLGESLVLPPFLEDRREEIEAGLVPVTNPRQVGAR
jgi:glyoxalase family protein